MVFLCCRGGEGSGLGYCNADLSTPILGGSRCDRFATDGPGLCPKPRPVWRWIRKCEGSKIGSDALLGRSVSGGCDVLSGRFNPSSGGFPMIPAPALYSTRASPAGVILAGCGIYRQPCNLPYGTEGGVAGRAGCLRVSSAGGSTWLVCHKTIPSWQGHPRSMQSHSWLRTGPPKNQTLRPRALSTGFWSCGRLRAVTTALGSLGCSGTISF